MCVCVCACWVDGTQSPDIPEGQRFGVLEGSSNGYVLGTVLATDVDAGDSLSFKVGDSDDAGNDGTFTINNAGVLSIANETSTALDYVEAGSNTFQIPITVTDRDGASFTQSITIDVVDNNFPPTLESVTFTIPEAVPPAMRYGDVVGTVVGSDPDVVQQLEYSIVAVTPSAATPMFTITTEAPSGGNQGSGVLSIVDTSSILGGSVFLDHESMPEVLVTVSVKDNGVGQLTASAVITVQVSDMAEAPVITAPVAGQLFVAENSAVNTPVGPPLASHDQDAGHEVLDYSIAWTDATGEGELPFVIGANSGQVTVAGDLDYETKASYAVTVTVADSTSPTPLTDSTDVVIKLENVNEDPVIDVSSLQMSVQENAGVGVVLGSVIASDVDGPFLEYSLLPPAGSSESDPAVAEALATLRIDRLNGQVSVAAATIDYERRQRYDLMVKVTDNGPGPLLSATQPLVVTVVDVNDLQFTSIEAVASGDSTSSGDAILHSTAGGETVVLHGANMGFVDPVSHGSLPVTVTYTSRQGGNVYTATGCSVSITNTAIQCTTAPGVGAQLVWTLTVGPWTYSTNDITTAYFAPTITSVVDADALPTAGGSTFYVRGTNFGPADTKVQALTYWSEHRPEVLYAGTECHVSSPHVEVACTSVPGVGKDLRVSLAIQFQASNVVAVGGPGGTTSLSHGPPTITSVALLSGGSAGSDESAARRLLAGGVMATAGGEVVRLTGENLGPASGHVVTGTMGPTSDPTRYASSQCLVTVANTQVDCITPAGVGTDMRWQVTVGGIVSAQSEDTLDYKAPVIAAVDGPGAQDANTPGGQDIHLTGSMMGSSTDPHSDLVAIYGPVEKDEAEWYTAVNCRVDQNHVRVTCTMNEGTGTGHSWKVRVGGQWSEVIHANTGYARPVLISYTGPGSDKANTEGGQEVVIEGRQFGPLGASRIDRVQYGEGPTLVDVTDLCTVSTAHTFITCTLREGAGAGLTWDVTIDGQASGQPTTNYDAPIIVAIDGAGAEPIRTDGGQQLTVLGSNFGPATATSDAFLQALSYGPTGTEYSIVTSCTVESHTTIQCTTAPGVGANLLVSATVMGQQSYPSDVRISYAAPSISSLSKTVGSTQGGFQVAVTGTNFGFATTSRFRPADSTAPVSSVQVSFGGATLAETAVTSWEMLGADEAGQSVHRFLITVPEATTFGRDRAIAVTVRDDATGNTQTSATSAATTFQYADPEITGVFKLLGGRLILEGSNFGTAGHVVVVDGDPTLGSQTTTSVEADVWEHTRIEISYGGSSGTVKVYRGEQGSNEGVFERVAPSISALTGEDGAGKPFATRGGELLTMRGKNLGESDKLHLLNVTVQTQDRKGQLVKKVCEIVSFEEPVEEDGDNVLQCRIPRGQGTQQKVVMHVGGHASTGSDGSATTIDYMRPSVTGTQMLTPDLAPGPAFWPTDGLHPTSRQPYRLRVSGDNFGIANRVVSLWRCDTAAVALSPTTQVCHDRARLSLDACSAQAAVLGEPLSDGCLEGQAQNFDELSFMHQLTSCDFTDTTATCDPPVGDGRALFVVVSVTMVDGSMLHDNADDATSSARRLATTDLAATPTHDPRGARLLLSAGATFAAPAVVSTTPTGGSEGGYTMTVRGLNFGRASTPVTIAIGSFPCPGVVHNHTVATCTVSPGQGKDLPVVVTVAGLESPSTTTFSYQPPRVTSASLASADTSGLALDGTREVIQINGTDFGTTGVVLLKPVTGTQYMAEVVAGSWQHDSVLVYVPAGQGANLEVVVQAGGQSSFGHGGPLFSYNPPDVACAPGGVEPGCALSKHSSWQTSRPAEYSDLTVLLPTDGYYNMTLKGRSMGVSGAQVLLQHNMPGFGGVCAIQGLWTTACTLNVLSQTHTEVVFEMPPGIGAGFTISVRVGGQTSPDGTTAAYDLPIITNIRPNEASALGQVLKFDGKNFGDRNTGPKVVIHGMNCTDARLVDGEARGGVVAPDFIQCDASGDTVGFKNITLSIAGQTRAYALHQGLLAYFCPNGHYGTFGEVCLECPRGALCRGGLAEPVSIEGWWLQNATLDQCPPERQSRPAPFEGTCPQVRLLRRDAVGRAPR